MSVENMGNGYVKVGVKQEDLEESIAGLRQLKPILQAQVTRGNGNNKRQAAVDRAEIGKHFDTAINAMLILYSAFEASEMTEDEIIRGSRRKSLLHRCRYEKEQFSLYMQPIQRQHIRKGAQYSICKAFNKTCIAIRIYADYHTFVFDTGIK